MNRVLQVLLLMLVIGIFSVSAKGGGRSSGRGGSKSGGSSSKGSSSKGSSSSGSGSSGSGSSYPKQQWSNPAPQPKQPSAPPAPPSYPGSGSGYPSYPGSGYPSGARPPAYPSGPGYPSNPGYPSGPHPPSYPGNPGYPGGYPSGPQPPSYPGNPGYPGGRPPSYPSHPGGYPAGHPGGYPSYPGGYPGGHQSFPSGPFKPAKTGIGSHVGAGLAGAAVGAVVGGAIVHRIRSGGGHNHYYGHSYRGGDLSSSEEYFVPYYTRPRDWSQTYYGRERYGSRQDSRVNGPLPNDDPWNRVPPAVRLMYSLCEKFQQPTTCAILKMQGFEPYFKENQFNPPNGTLPEFLPERNDTTVMAVNGTNPQVLNGTNPQVLNGTNPQVLNGTDTMVLNGTDTAVLNGTDKTTPKGLNEEAMNAFIEMWDGEVTKATTLTPPPARRRR